MITFCVFFQNRLLVRGLGLDFLRVAAASQNLSNGFSLGFCDFCFLGSAGCFSKLMVVLVMFEGGFGRDSLATSGWSSDGGSSKREFDLLFWASFG